MGFSQAKTAIVCFYLTDPNESLITHTDTILRAKENLFASASIGQKKIHNKYELVMHADQQNGLSFLGLKFYMSWAQALFSHPGRIVVLVPTMISQA